MVLAMARPYKHPKTGVYYFRRRIPTDLVGHLGRSLEKRSLGTKDPSEARVRFAAVSAEVEALWQGARESLATRAPEPVMRRLTHKEVHAIAGEVYRSVVGRHEDDPAPQAAWQRELTSDRWMRPPKERPPGTPPIPASILFGHNSHAPRRAMPYLMPILRTIGVEPDGPSKDLLVQATAAALEQAHGHLARLAAGDYSPDPLASRFPALPEVVAPKPEPLPFEEVREKWRREAKLGDATCKRWFPIVEKLLVHAKVADLRAVDEVKARAWIVALRESGLSDETIRKGNLAAAKALFSWLKDEKLATSNPFAEVKVRAEKPTLIREKGLTFEEARTILGASLASPPPRLSREMAAARRWVPWLLAYTGARVNELTQLRREDVFKVQVPNRPEVAVIHITPAAGRVKTGVARKVAIHPHLLEQGFLDFVASLDRPRLFYVEATRRRGEGTPRAEIVGDRLASWVRSIGIDDPAVDPNHAWRHRFKSLCREAGVLDDVSSAIMGHASGDIAASYGDVWAHVMRESISRIGCYRDLV